MPACPHVLLKTIATVPLKINLQMTQIPVANLVLAGHQKQMSATVLGLRWESSVALEAHNT